ncbi:MAG: hypothetical protein JXB49_18335, partial [Bacteroidales bacterium]|nr:hypothetical protein [Bacteroidales bacterium]
FALVCAGMVLFNSCENDDGLSEIDIENQEVADDESTSTSLISYYIDDEKVHANDFDSNLSNIILIEVYRTNSLKSDENELEVEKRAYTSEDKYVAFGDANNLKLKELLDFEKIMSSFAETSGVIEEFEKTNVMPQRYLEREVFVYDSLFNETMNQKSSMSIFVTLYEDHYVPGVGSGKCCIMPKFLPFMPPGWNNRVSCVEFVGIGGGAILFGNNFYRDRICTIVNWASDRVNLSYGADNCMSSGMKIF